MPSLAGLTALELIEVNNNRLTSLPSLAGLADLVSLSASNNQLASLPDLQENVDLALLDAGDNLLTSAPDLEANVDLALLDLSDNQLTSPPDLSTNILLETLLLNDNRLTSLPDLSANTAITTLGVSGNPLSNLSALTLTGSDGNAIALDAAFDGATTTYSANAAAGVTGVTVTPTAADTGVMPTRFADALPAPVIKVGPKGGTLAPVTSGMASALIALSQEGKEIDIEVTGRANGPKTYTVTVNAHDDTVDATPPAVSAAVVDGASLCHHLRREPGRGRGPGEHRLHGQEDAGRGQRADGDPERFAVHQRRRGDADPGRRRSARRFEREGELHQAQLRQRQQAPGRRRQRGGGLHRPAGDQQHGRPGHAHRRHAGEQHRADHSP